MSKCVRITCLFALAFSASAFCAEAPAAEKTLQQRNEEKYEILERNAIDDTDVLAIPLDDSEVEDEEEINRDTKREVFSLPAAG